MSTIDDLREKLDDPSSIFSCAEVKYLLTNADKLQESSELPSYFAEGKAMGKMYSEKLMSKISMIEVISHEQGAEAATLQYE